MPPTLGTFEFTALLDAGRVQDVAAALVMMSRLLDGHEHPWTLEERTALIKAIEACERRNLVIGPKP